MADQNEFVDFIDMRLNDPELQSWDGRSQPLDLGMYIFQVDKSSVDKSRAGNPVLLLSLKVVSEGPMLGRVTRQSYVIDPNKDASRRRMKCVIDALGAPQDADGRFSVQGLTGLQMRAEVIANSWTDHNDKGEPVERTGTKVCGEEPVAAAAPQPTTQPRPVVARRPAGNTQPAARQ